VQVARQTRPCNILGVTSLKIDAMSARPSSVRSTIAIGAIALACAGCRDFTAAPVAPDLPAGAQTLVPPPEYVAWWTATEKCAGRSGDLARVSWFSLPGRTSFTYLDSQYNGYWWDGVHWILLAGEKVQDGLLVRHEMLHELLGRGDHPAEYFQQRCAGIVACNDLCRADG
jgi:hypothetical protein